MSIARAVLEYAADRKQLGAKTNAATHYHELTVLEISVDGVKNFKLPSRSAATTLPSCCAVLCAAERMTASVSRGGKAGRRSQQGDCQRAKQILAELEEGKAVSMPGQGQRRAPEPDQSLQLSIVPGRERARSWNGCGIWTQHIDAD